VGRTFLRMLVEKRELLRRKYGIEWQLTGVASRRIGWIANPAGLEPEELLAGKFPGEPLWKAPQGCRQWLGASKAEVFFEATSLNHKDGQPAIEHLRAALESGAHAVTANKGPIVFAYRDLRDLARTKGLKFLYESTVMDGAPIFSMFPHSLPATEIRGFRGVLNATTNVVLSEMENGLTLEEGVKVAQKLGIAETDPSADLDGWDAAVKVAALVNVLMDHPLRLEEVERAGIREFTPEHVKAIRASNLRCKLVCRAERTPEGGVRASVRPEQLRMTDPLAHLEGNSSGLRFDLDVFGLSVIEHEYESGAVAPAYGMLADFVRATGAV